MTQPTLFDLPAPTPLSLVIHCPVCSGLVSVEIVTGSWDEAIKWGYLAQQKHTLTDCPKG
jgi:hypothetical protein